MPQEGPPIRYARRAIPPKLVRARALAAEIETLLGELTADEIESCAYQVRLAEGLTRSLIDQLEELERGPASSRRLLGAAPLSQPEAAAPLVPHPGSARANG